MTTKGGNEELKASLWAQREMGLKGDNWDNYAVALHTLQAEIDPNGKHLPYYEFDERTRDILIAHARQDAAHALANTTSLLRQTKRLTWLAYLSLFLWGGLIGAHKGWW